jgi:DNA replication protein DnaC
VIYKCEECSDTGWVITDNNRYTRCKCVEINFIKRCWENYGIKPDEVKSLKDYIPYNKQCAAAKQKAVKYIENYSMVSAAENNWYGLFGQAGAGKSYIAIAIGAALLTMEHKPRRVVYMPYIEAMRELKVNVLDDECYIKILNHYQRAEVLVIDDLFKDKIKNKKIAYELTEADIKHIYPIINFRYFNKLPTVISSECTPNMLLELDEALGGRILERCDENITVFVGEEYNYRLKKFERN